MTQESTDLTLVPFDLDEDSIPDAVAVDTDHDGVIDVVGFDLDEDSVPDMIATDRDADGVLDTASGFDLDSDLADTVPADIGDPAVDDTGIDADSYTPPDDITGDDLEQAQGDLEHSQLMNEYMVSRGVIS